MKVLIVNPLGHPIEVFRVDMHIRHLQRGKNRLGHFIIGQSFSNAVIGQDVDGAHDRHGLIPLRTLNRSGFAGGWLM